MATVTGYTAARMQAIENASVIDGDVVGNDLILTKFDATTINAGNVRGPTGSTGATGPASPSRLIVAVSDEVTAITVGVGKVTFRMPYAMTVTEVRASLTVASSAGIPTVDINDSGVTILSTKLTIDATEKTSLTAAVAAVISDTALADDAEITIDIDVAGTGAMGLKVMIIGNPA